MELLDEFIRMKDIEYIALVEKEKSKAEKAMQHLLSDEKRMKAQEIIEKILSNEEKGKQSNERAVLVLFIWPFYESLILFRNEELIIRLKEFQFTDAVLRWFVSIDEINQQFDLIIQKGIKIDKVFALNCIKDYLKGKFVNDTMYWVSGIYKDGKTPVNLLTKTAILVNDRKKNSARNPKTTSNPMDSYIGEAMNKFDQYAQSQNEFNIGFIELIKGKTEKLHLKILLENCFDYHGMKKPSKTKFLNAVYDLFRIVINDYNLPTTENEFKNISGFYNNKIERFKAIKLKKIIYKI
ncbi:MAG TPA: hypothetical protein VK718_03345 [Ferruginibacter sp.]|jgi:hypothetical protein|nr:hypothetical protein [Ferruginibacter sp.]